MTHGGRRLKGGPDFESLGFLFPNSHRTQNFGVINNHNKRVMGRQIASVMTNRKESAPNVLNLDVLLTLVS